MTQAKSQEISSAEAVQKAKEAAQAVEAARMDQINASNLESEKRISQAITGAIEKAFKLDDNKGEQRFIDTARIPRICQDIKQMKEDISEISGDLKWGVRVVIGAVILALLGMLWK